MNELQVCSIVECEASQSEYGYSSSSCLELFGQGGWTALHLGVPCGGHSSDVAG